MHVSFYVTDVRTLGLRLGLFRRHGCFDTLDSVKLPIVGVRQIKLPVSDLARSARWYADLFDLELANEFYEDSAVRGGRPCRPHQWVRDRLA